LIEKKIDSVQEHLEHIANVMNERVLLYKKRYREIRRSVKAMSRLDEILEPRTTFLVLEAEIQYALNLAGYHAINSLIQELNLNNKWLDIGVLSNLVGDEAFREIFTEKIADIDSILKKIDVKKSDLITMIEVVMNLNEDIQRKIIANFILDYIKPLITIVFKDISILDDDYTNKVIENYKQNHSFY